jgi:hypothetical protein
MTVFEEEVTVALTVEQWVVVVGTLQAVTSQSGNQTYERIAGMIDAQIVLAIELQHPNAGLS